jgi:hypothetical protein
MRMVLGSEAEPPLRTALEKVLAARGARRLWSWRGHAGSQELERAWYLVRGGILRVHAETYAGLAILGPRRVVEDITKAVQQSLSPRSDVLRPNTRCN